MDAAVLTQKALKLTVVERVHLIDALWASLDNPEQTEIDLAWLNESQSRLDAYHEGQIEVVDGQSVFSEIKKSLET
ncbi:addiction module protein [Roseofilum reptotaenium CS-1145]|uniref:Addiction module protein n=1 Tax=Roseofilum reptotaenium AO1-A TaxID=1925591 RepID=A0A1L9QK41_9CYAN|nr:addiction module protein [Roseofilum reptotaenium]MDB9516781.1 addiction module protein [Roseofilum reptotaenium CS-1145]OJJ15958.1 hypothetical protein BI308_23990 [Roseofilum reptotaenium AO1-A]